jgi:hypothetical protein
MKSLTIKIPLTIAQSMDDRGQLNPRWATNFVITYMNKPLPDQPIQEFTFNYTFKVEDDLHRTLKLKSFEQNIPMNELIGRLLATYY